MKLVAIEMDKGITEDGEIRDRVKWAASRAHLTYDGPAVVRALDAVIGQRARSK